MKRTIEIDGRQGEGGGQILRTSLSLAVALQQPIHMTHIRDGRKRGGLMRQHLACVRAAAEICGGEIEGAELRSGEIRFQPGPVRAGEYSFSVGSAGSTLLVLQTVLAPLLRADGDSVVRIEGGTHNPMAPAFGFVEASLAPQLRHMGAGLELELERPGFYPPGGGCIVARISPGKAKPLDLKERGEEGHHMVHIGSAHLDADIADREWDAIRRSLHWTSEHRRDLNMDGSVGPGNFMDIHLVFKHVTQVFTVFGEPRVSGKRLAGGLASQAKQALRSTSPVEEHLADQLMLPAALLAGGCYRTSKLSSHSTTNAQVINMFAPGTVQLGDGGAHGFPVQINPIFGGPPPPDRA